MMDNENNQMSANGLDSDDPDVRKGALAKVFMAAPDTDADPRDIAACLNDPEEGTRILAIETLGKLGSQTIPLMLDALDPEQPDPVRISGASCLGRMGSDAAPAVEPLCACLESDNEELRWHAGFALSKIGTPAFPEVKNKLDSDNPMAVMASVQALGWMETMAVEAVDSIRSLGEKQDPKMTAICAAALVSIAGDTEKGLAELLSGTDTDDAALKKLCISEIGLLGDRAKEIRLSLIPLLSDPDSEIRSETALALARIGHPTPELVEALKPLISDTDNDVRKNAGIALSAYGPEASPALADLQVMVQDEDPGVRAVAQAAIQAIQGQAKDGAT